MTTGVSYQQGQTTYMVLLRVSNTSFLKRINPSWQQRAVSFGELWSKMSAKFNQTEKNKIRISGSKNAARYVKPLPVMQMNTQSHSCQKMGIKLFLGINMKAYLCWSVSIYPERPQLLLSSTGKNNSWLCAYTIKWFPATLPSLNFTELYVVCSEGNKGKNNVSTVC